MATTVKKSRDHRGKWATRKPHSYLFSYCTIQRKDSQKLVPAVLQVVKTELNDEAGLTQAFREQDVFISAVGVPAFENEKIWLDVAIAASVKRIIPSEFTTNLESPLAIQLPVATEKVKARQYLTSKITSSSAPTT
ncbi:uncharacterized protein ACHE_31253A [Aspergillus chevalieri]|uniref:NmrA-like domain-containing protein n=1 Tax=Aspergillus chevalieri TaxID=182096 RepID=A0A7R7VME1_ASPCH|nr:uncharacterized protein ACHE_31253A [Aspergillus chevalieri]BCR87266.1 hypothetical protein ACHE_31253A [Aspergillus chevalieri]